MFVSFRSIESLRLQVCLRISLRSALLRGGNVIITIQYISIGRSVVGIGHRCLSDLLNCCQFPAWSVYVVNSLPHCFGSFSHFRTYTINCLERILNHPSQSAIKPFQSCLMSTSKQIPTPRIPNHRLSRTMPRLRHFRGGTGCFLLLSVSADSL